MSTTRLPYIIAILFIALILLAVFILFLTSITVSTPLVTAKSWVDWLAGLIKRLVGL